MGAYVETSNALIARANRTGDRRNVRELLGALFFFLRSQAKLADAKTGQERSAALADRTLGLTLQNDPPHRRRSEHL